MAILTRRLALGAAIGGAAVGRALLPAARAQG